jgi:hypothetical protein
MTTDSNKPLSSIELQHALINNFSELPSGYQIRDILVFNVPKKDFKIKIDDSVAQKIGDLKRETESKKVFDLLIDSLHRRHLGTLFAANNAYYEENTPKTMVVVESLMSQDKKTVVGERFWGLVLDEKYNPNEAIKEFLSENRTSMNKNQIANKTRIPNAQEIGERYEFIDFPSLARKIYIPYLEKCESLEISVSETIPLLLQEENFMVHDAVFNVSNVFSSKNAIERLGNLEKDVDICDEQASISSYFEEGDPIPKKFKRKFPMPTQTMRILPEWSTPKEIRRLPLPKNFFNKIANKGKIADEIEKLQERLEDVHFVSDVNEIEETHQKIMQMEEELQAIENSVPESITSDGNPLIEGGLTDENCKKIMKGRSIFWQLKDKNYLEIAKIRNEFPRKESKSHRDAMNSFYQKAIQETFDVLMNENIAEKTESVKTAVRWFKTLPPEEQWVENLLTCANLSSFGNSIVQLMDRADKGIEKPIETNFQLFLLCYFSALTSFEFSWSLRPNLLISGDGGTGKSHVIEAVQAIISPGASMRFGHMTLRSQDIDLDLSQATLFCDEMPLHYLGVDPSGRPIAADGPFKDRVAKQYSSTLSFRRDDETGRRMADLQVSRQMQTLVFANNNPCPPADSALMQRFVNVYVNKVYRTDREVNSSVYRTQQNEILELQAEITRYMQVHATHQLFYNVMIEAGALPPIDHQALIIISKWVFEKLTKEHNIPDLTARRMDQMKMLCHQVHMFHVINSEFFSETGLSHRLDSKKKPKPLQASDYLGLLKHGAVSQEVAAFTLTLLEGVLVPKFKSKLCQVFIQEFCGVVDPMKIPCNSPHFRKSVKEDGEKNDRYQSDYNYVSIVGTSLAQIYQKFSKSVEGRPSQNVVNNILNDMRSEYIEVSIREKEDLPIPGGGIATFITVRDKTKKSKEKLPLVIFDSDPQSKSSQKRISLLIDALPPNDTHRYQNILLDAIKSALSFDCQIDSDFVSAVPYVRLVKSDKYKNTAVDEDEDDEEEDDDEDVTEEMKYKAECFPSLLSLIRVSKKAKEKRFLENSYALTPLDMISLFNRVGNKYGNSIMAINRYDTTTIGFFDISLDDYFYYTYCMSAGLDPEDKNNLLALPINQKKLAVSLRKTNPYFSKQTRWIRNYPLDNVMMMDKMFDLRRNKEKVKQTVSRMCRARTMEDLQDDDEDFLSFYPEMYISDVTAEIDNDSSQSKKRRSPEFSRDDDPAEFAFQDPGLITRMRQFNDRQKKNSSEKMTIDEVMTATIFSDESQSLNPTHFVEKDETAVDTYRQNKGHVEIHEFTSIFKRRKNNPSSVVVDKEKTAIAKSPRSPPSNYNTSTSSSPQRTTETNNNTFNVDGVYNNSGFHSNFRGFIPPKPSSKPNSKPSSKQSSQQQPMDVIEKQKKKKTPVVADRYQKTRRNYKSFSTDNEELLRRFKEESLEYSRDMTSLSNKGSPQTASRTFKPFSAKSAPKKDQSKNKGKTFVDENSINTDRMEEDGEENHLPPRSDDEQQYSDEDEDNLFGDR